MGSRRWRGLGALTAVVALTAACAGGAGPAGSGGSIPEAGPATSSTPPADGTGPAEPPADGPGTPPTAPARTGDADAGWVASTCAALGSWLADADRDEESLRGLALRGGTEPEALRRKALAVVDASTARTADLQARLGTATGPADPDLAALAAETDRVLGETVDVLEEVRPGIAGLPVADPQAFARAAVPLVGQVLVAEAAMVADLAAAVERARASGAGSIYASTAECRAVDSGLRLATPP